MPTIQLSCPYCKATLNFAQALPAGCPVACLICNRSFAAPVAKAVSAAMAPAVAAVPPRLAAAPVAAKSAMPSPQPASTPAKVHAVPVDPATASGGTLRAAVTGAAVAIVAIVVLGGMAYFVYVALANRNRDAKSDLPVQLTQGPDLRKDAQPPVAAGADTPPAKKDETSPKKVDPPAKSGGEVDVADLKKPAKPAPPPVTRTDVTPKTPEPDFKGPPPPTVEIVVPAVPIAPGVTRERVDAAIANGVRFLKSRQDADGSWQGSTPHRCGQTALTALALLECDVPADDPAMLKAAHFVRERVPTLHDTYEVATAILFLDRLRLSEDRALIRTLALQLAAAQLDSGGWNYATDPLRPEDLNAYETHLRVHWPWSRDRPRPAAPAPINKEEKKGAVRAGPAINLQNLPVAELLWNRGLNRVNPGNAPGDNSSTQFALLALWAARRHELPTECPILLSHQRFRLTQNSDGGFSYSPGMMGSTKTMTCAGLLALAMGPGAIPPERMGAKAKGQDPLIGKGLHALAGYIGAPAADASARPPMENLYFLWSVERVGMLFNLKTIGGKDWYAWGAQMLLANQRTDGSWQGANYPGTGDILDTSFALLFLKRSNLAADLTEHLRLHMVIRDPGAK